VSQLAPQDYLLVHGTHLPHSYLAGARNLNPHLLLQQLANDYRSSLSLPKQYKIISGLVGTAKIPATTSIASKTETTVATLIFQKPKTKIL
jgi:hypothetical protein